MLTHVVLSGGKKTSPFSKYEKARATVVICVCTSNLIIEDKQAAVIDRPNKHGLLLLHEGAAMCLIFKHRIKLFSVIITQ